MSKNETPITRWYWQQLGGLLVEEFCLVSRGPACGTRLVDALVLPERETRLAGHNPRRCVLIFGLARLDTGGRLGHALICADARYASIAWVGGGPARPSVRQTFAL